MIQQLGDRHQYFLASCQAAAAGTGSPALWLLPGHGHALTVANPPVSVSGLHGTALWLGPAKVGWGMLPVGDTLPLLIGSSVHSSDVGGWRQGRELLFFCFAAGSFVSKLARRTRLLGR